MTGGGVLNINKPSGWTSHDVVARVRGLLKVKKAGHAGTLDPQATGVLPVCFGKGTKVAEYLMATEKEYRAVMRLGEETDTEDATGRSIRRCDRVNLSDAAIQEALGSFVGTYDQLPPLYSAVKVGGVPLYKAARAGLEVQRERRSVTIRRIEFEKRTGSDVWFTVACGKGTYIRTLCADVGKALSVGAHLFSLCRTRVGIFRLEDSIELSDLKRGVLDGSWPERVYSLARVLSHFSEVSVAGPWEERVCHGVPIPLSQCAALGTLPEASGAPSLVRVCGLRGGLLAIAKVSEDLSLGPCLRIEKVLVDPQDQGVQPVS